MPQNRKTPKASSAAEGDDENGPLRLCIVTRERYPKAVMLRFVVSPAGEVVFDLLGKLPGRGMNVIADRKALETALAKNLFARAAGAAGAAVTVPPGLADEVEAQLVRRALQLLGQAKGAGALILGLAGVQDAARKGEAAAVLIAVDAAADSRRKSLNAVRAGQFAGEEKMSEAAPFVSCFTGAEMSLALGRENVIHAALKKGGLTNLFLSEIRRLQGFRAFGPVVGARGGAPSPAAGERVS